MISLQFLFLAFHTKHTSTHIDLTSQGRLYGTCFPITRTGLLLWHSLRETQRIGRHSWQKSLVEVNLWAGWESCQLSNRQWTHRFTVCALLQARSMFVLSPVADWRPCPPNKNTVRDSSARHEIDFVLTNMGICFSHTVKSNHFEEWGEDESKIINSQQ